VRGLGTDAVAFDPPGEVRRTRSPLSPTRRQVGRAVARRLPAMRPARFGLRRMLVSSLACLQADGIHRLRTTSSVWSPRLHPIGRSGLRAPDDARETVSSMARLLGFKWAIGHSLPRPTRYRQRTRPALRFRSYEFGVYLRYARVRLI
jgi:hypothetical protein